MSAAPAVSGRRRDLVVYGAGLAQGIVLVSFPAAEPVLRGDPGFGFSSSAYGLLFLPQVVLAVLASVLGGAVSRRVGLRKVFFAGLLADGLSMVLFAASALIADERGTSYAVLLVATAALGAGFGFTVPTLSSLAADVHPDAADRALLTLNALLGLGTALAPVLSAAFLGLGAWWGLPVLSAVLVAVLLVAARRTSLTTPSAHSAPVATVLAARRFWLLAAVALLYGVVETMSGNWSEPLARADLALSATVASIMLATFWASVTVGRLLFAAAGRRLPHRIVYVVLPVVVAVAFVLASLLPSGAPLAAVAVSALAGLGCSALLPLTVGLGQDGFPADREAMAGLLIAAYQIGYGVAAFGVGPLGSAGVSLQSLFGAAGVVALALAAGALLVTREARTTKR